MSAYDDFTASLDATNVLSDDYKRSLRLTVQKIQSDAYQRGQEDGPQVQPHPTTRSAVRRYVLGDTIRTVLQQRCDAEDSGVIELAYTAGSGAYSERQVSPVRIFTGPSGHHYGPARDYLLAIDVQKGEPRHFKVDNIEWIEVSE